MNPGEIPDTSLRLIHSAAGTWHCQADKSKYKPGGDNGSACGKKGSANS
jgi:hypothetical protein